MNYYRAREVKGPDGQASGIWHYTKMNDGRVSPEGYCKKRNCKHSTPLEASNCYRDYINQECGGLLPGGFKMIEKKGSREHELVMTSSY